MPKKFASHERSASLWGCVLIGGRSSRMGRPKHLLARNGLTWLEITVHKLLTQVERVVISGAGKIPPSLASLPVVFDVPGLEGPLAGVLAVYRQYPGVSWLVTACDLPDLSTEALGWLTAYHFQGARAVLPDLLQNGQVEPLLAYYNESCAELLEKLAASGSLKLSDLVGQHGVITPQPPKHLHGSWRNINQPHEITVGR